MSLRLSDYESGLPYGGDYSADLAALQARLKRIQAAYILHRGSALIVFEGWDAAGKGGVIKRLAAGRDPRWCEVWPIGPPNLEEADHHFLWRFWQKLPAKGVISVFDRSWYGRVLVERIEGFWDSSVWQRSYDEINEFEAQLHDNGTVIIKIFLHITPERQDKRLRARLADPWRRWKTGPDDFRNRAKRSAYLDAYADMFERCSTRWAPWKVIDGNNKKAARIAALSVIAEEMEARIDMKPPAMDETLKRIAKTAFVGTPSDLSDMV